MSEAQRLLAGLQLADSFFPSGLFTQSYGLEQWVALGLHGLAQLAPLLAEYLVAVVGPTDAVAVRWTVAAAADLALVEQIDHQLEAVKLTSESRAGSRRSGQAVLTVGAAALEDNPAHAYLAQVKQGAVPGHHAVAFGLLCTSSGVAAATAVLLELHAFTTSWLAAAVRLGALDYQAAQQLRHMATPWIVTAADAAMSRDWRQMGGWSPLVDCRQMQHAAAAGRLFAS